MKKYTLIIILLLFTVAALSLTRVYMTNTISTSGLILSEMENSIREYKIENAVLGQKVYSYSSLTTLASKAENLGFIGQQTRLVLTGSVPIAAKQ